MQLTTNSSTGSSCGTELYETESYSLTDINSDIFSGITAPCLGWVPGDTQQEKMQKLINKLCSTDATVQSHTTQIDNNTVDIASLTQLIDTLTMQLNYVTEHLFDCCGTMPPSSSFAGTSVELCTESIQGRITYTITYDGIAGISNIQVLQKALLVPTSTPNQVISVTNNNMIVPSPSGSDMRVEIANISNLNNKFRLLVQYEEAAIVKQGYLFFDLPHFQLTDNLCNSNIGTFESLYVV